MRRFSMLFLMLLMITTMAKAGIRLVSPGDLSSGPGFEKPEMPRDRLLTTQVRQARQEMRAQSIADKIEAHLRPALDPKSGGISGSLTAPASPGDCMWDVTIMALDEHGILVDSDWVGFGSQGDYELYDLPDGDYYVYTITDGWDEDVTRGTLIHEFYNNTADWTQAMLVSVSGGTASGIDFALESNSGYLEATLRDGAGQPIADQMVSVDLYPFQPGSDELPERDNILFRDHMTDSSGHLTVGPIPLGIFYIAFRVFDYGVIYYPNTPDPEQAQALEITTVGQTLPNIDINLPPGGSLSGTIHLDTGDPAFGTVVEVFMPGDDVPVASSGVYNFDGSYTVAGLPPGDYLVYANPSFVYPEYAPEYYDDEPSAETADLVTVQSNQTTEGINFILAPGGMINGTVVLDVPNSDDYFFFLSAFTLDDSINPVGTGFGFANEEYTLGGLRDGQYKVSLMGIPFPLIPLYYDDMLSFDEADIITITGANTVTGIDFNIPRRGTIEGTVTLAGGGNANDDIVDFVIAYPESMPLEGDVTDLLFMFPSYVDDNGDYSIAGIPTGNYKVWIATNPEEYDVIGYVPEYYGEHHDFMNADVIAVTEGQTVSGIDVELNPEAICQGYVSLPDGSPASDEDVEVIIIAYSAETGAPAGFAVFDDAPIFTWDNNTFCAGYRLRRLPAGTTKIAAIPIGANAAVSYYGGGHTFDQAGTVDLSSGQVHPMDLDIQLESANQTISGMVTHDDGEPLSLVLVASYDLTGHLSGIAMSGMNMATGLEWQPGRYEIQSLASGSTHYVRTWSLFAWIEYVFLNPGSEVIPEDEWYQDVTAPLLPLELGFLFPFGFYYFMGFMPYEQPPLEATQVSAGSANINFTLGFQGLGIDHQDTPLPENLSISGIWPNPVRHHMTLELSLPSAGKVHVELLDISGRRMSSIGEMTLPRGVSTIDIAMDSGETTLSSGVYAIRIFDGNGISSTGRFVLIR